MAELRFTSAPPGKKPNRALLAAGLIVLLAAAFGVGRLWTPPPPPQTAVAVPTALPPERPSPPPEAAAAAPPSAAPTAAAAPPQGTLQTSSEVFTIPRTRAPATPAEPTVTPAAEAEKGPARCLSFTVSRDSMFTVTSGIRLLIKARNRCNLTIAGSEAKFEVRAMAANGSGVAGRERGSFQSSIQPFESAETVIVVPCNPDGVYRFEVEVM